MRRAIQANFNENLVFGPHTDRLIRQDLKEAVLESDGKVVEYGPFRAQGEDFFQPMRWKKRPMSIGAVGWINGAAGIVVRDIDFPEEFVGCFHGGNAGQAQFLDQAILMGSEAALHAALGLRAVGGDDFDVELFHGAGKLSDGIEIPQFLFDGRLEIDLVDRIFINVEGDGAAMAQQIGLRRAQQGQSILDMNELAVEDAAGGVVDVDDQDAAWSSSLKPIMIGAIELLQHAHAGPALAPGSVFRFGLLGLPDSVPDHSTTQSGDGNVDSMQLLELFIGKGRAEVFIFGLDQRQRLIQEPDLELMIGRPASQAVHDSAMSLPMHFAAQSSNLARAPAQLVAGLPLRELAFQDLMNDLQAIAFTHAHSEYFP